MVTMVMMVMTPVATMIGMTYTGSGGSFAGVGVGEVATGMASGPSKGWGRGHG